jgi:C4-dicarboxylate-specific signal transduction histidine kinase
MLKPLLESHCIVVRNQCEPSITLNSKSDILGHVVLIIIQNAINALSIATHKERQITLSTFTTSSHIGICVEDNGGGIEPSKLNHLFSKTLKSKSGLGFGLHLAHFLTSKELSGAIKAYNTHQGAKFELVVPLK